VTFDAVAATSASVAANSAAVARPAGETSIHQDGDALNATVLLETLSARAVLVSQKGLGSKMKSTIKSNTQMGEVMKRADRLTLCLVNHH